MVLIRVLCVLLAVAGCNQSLFDAHGKPRDGGPGDDGGGDGGVDDECGAMCVADAVKDFDGTPFGTGNRWKYLQDFRNRLWLEMPVANDKASGGGNEITRCDREPAEAPCAALSDSLLVRTAGTTGPSDPALAYTAGATGVLKLSFHVHASTPHTVRVYRNSREDVLLTIAAPVADTLKRAVIVDAIPGDRFLIALEPTAAGGPVALRFFISDTGVQFPSTCQLAVPFTVPGSTANAVDDLCRGELVSWNGAPPMQTPPSPFAGPFPEHGTGVFVEPDVWLESTDLLDRSSGRLTIQFWVYNDLPDTNIRYAFSDADENTGGGVGIRFKNTGRLQLEVAVLQSIGPAVYTGRAIDYPLAPLDHHFVRVVLENGMVKICLNGRRELVSPLAIPSVGSTVRPHLGRNGPWFLEPMQGGLDDVRVFAEALQCD